MEACTSKQWAILKITRCRTGGCCEGLAWRDRGVEHLQYFHWLYYEHQLLQLTRLGCNLQAKATSCFSGRLFFLFCFSFDTTAQQRLDGFSPSPTDVFALLLVNGATPMKIGPPIFGGPKSPYYGAKIQTPPSSNGRCAETRRKYGKTKTTGITTISRLGNP